MGDRANVQIVQQGGGVVNFYTHWSGYRLPEIVRLALAHKQRWDDGDYLGRIVFCEMLKAQGKDALDETTGFGIGNSMGDNDGYPVIVLDPRAGAISFERGGRAAGVPAAALDSLARYTFTEYAALDCAEWPEH